MVYTVGFSCDLVMSPWVMQAGAKRARSRFVMLIFGRDEDWWGWSLMG